MAQRLSKEQQDEVRHLYKDKRWRVTDIARHMNVHYSSIEYWVKDIKRDSTKPKYLYTYKDILAQEEERKAQKRLRCSHPQPRLVVICLGCGEHLEQTKTHPALAEVKLLCNN